MTEPADGPRGFDPEIVVETQTDLGPLWAERDARVLTPALLATGTWDPTVGGLIRTALRPGDTFVDAGSNIGYFTVLASRQVGPEGRVFAIEPDPVNLMILRANIERHSCENVTVLPIAAWDERAELNIMRPPEDGAAARVGGPATGGARVEAAPLDELVEGPVDYLKVDTELTEHRVVKGARRLLDENPSMLVTVEFCPWEDRHTGESPVAVLDVYRDLNLRPHLITPPGDGVMPTSYARIADPALIKGHKCLDFALSREMPERLLYRWPLLERGATRLLGRKGLKRAGDLLELVPERIRPGIRHRDRKPPDG